MQVTELQNQLDRPAPAGVVAAAASQEAAEGSLLILRSELAAKEALIQRLQVRSLSDYWLLTTDY